MIRFLSRIFRKPSPDYSRLEGHLKAEIREAKRQHRSTAGFVEALKVLRTDELRSKSYKITGRMPKWTTV